MQPNLPAAGAINSLPSKQPGQHEASTNARDWMRVCSDTPLFLRTEAFFKGQAYEKHRHDAYAIGITLEGVQSIHYRGSMVHSVPGDTVVIHPEELHDGRAGTESGYRYRILHIQPGVLHDVLGGNSLPVVREGVSRDVALHRSAAAILRNLERPLEPLERDDLLFDLAMALQAAAGATKGKLTNCAKAALAARDYIHSQPTERVELGVLAEVAGRDRWSLSRDFRQYFGTSPSRYMTLRRLDIVRSLVSSGLPLATCAAAAGFADQSHMTRQFTEAFGMTPARWLNMQRES